MQHNLAGLRKCEGLHAPTKVCENGRRDLNRLLPCQGSALPPLELPKYFPAKHTLKLYLCWACG